MHTTFDAANAGQSRHVELIERSQDTYFRLLLPICRLPVAAATQTGAGTGMEEFMGRVQEFPEARQLDKLESEEYVDVPRDETRLHAV